MNDIQVTNAQIIGGLLTPLLLTLTMWLLLTSCRTASPEWVERLQIQITMMHDRIEHLESQVVLLQATPHDVNCLPEDRD